MTTDARTHMQDRAHVRTARRHSMSFYARRGLQYAVMIALSAIFLLPLVWLISSSLKQQSEVFAFPPVWIPNPPQWDNYAQALQRAPLLTWLKNTSIITLMTIIG